MSTRRLIRVVAELAATAVAAAALASGVSGAATGGGLDRSFGDSGIATVELGEGGSGRRVAIQQDGKLVVASIVGMSRPVLNVTPHVP